MYPLTLNSLATGLKSLGYSKSDALQRLEAAVAMLGEQGRELDETAVLHEALIRSA